MRKDWILPAFLALAVHGSPAFAADPDPVAVRRAVREVLSEERLQKDLSSAEAPAPEPDPPRDGGSRSGDSGGGSGAPVGPPAPPSPSGPLSSILAALLWTILAIGLSLLAVATIRSSIADRRDRRVLPPAPAPAAAAPGPAPPDPLADLDAMAEGGRHAEAMHGLLLRAIGDLRRNGRTALPDELTSREILERASLPPGPTRSLVGLVGSVERSLFGGRPTDRAAYDEARVRYLEVKVACAGRTA